MFLARPLLRVLVSCFGVCLLGSAPAKEENNLPTYTKEEVEEIKGKPREKDKNKDKKKKADDTKTARAVKYHIKNLNDPDPEVRKSSCEMLAIISSPDAVLPLIEMLDPARKEPLNVLLTANGALAKITGKNFGYKNYDDWRAWWAKNKDEFYKKAETGVSAQDKIAAEASNNAGRGYMQVGEYRTAQQYFLDAVNRDPVVPDYRNNLGLSLFEQGRYLDAMEYFQEVIGLDAELPQPYMNIGRCYSRLNKTIEAQAWYKKATDRDKDGRLWDLLYVIGKEYMRRAEWQMAFEYLDQARVKAEKQTPPVRDPRIYLDLAITHYGLDQYHSAWKEITNVKTLGFDVDEGFEKKVRKQLKDMGVDPDEEDRKAREHLREAEAGEEDDLSMEPKNTSRE
ncbi:MAG TPA: tetratricopeptide repeat protein [Planctomycetota bacterium]|nr:tetratricopeptide repeat protein [Planctomycetota bacterium]